MQRVAVAGLGGFAAEHHKALAQLEAEGVCRLVATCDPDPSHPALAGLTERGVHVYPTLEQLLDAHAGELAMLTLPTPLPLHALHHRIAVEAGVPCYIEKPPSLWWPEFRQMLEVEKRAKKSTQVGFNFVGDPMRLDLKRRILSGEFGRLREVRFEAYWPRDAVYYGRNNWAGRLRLGEQGINDSVIGNAMAHYVQNLLFWCGSSEFGVGQVHEVRAWLGRTHPIESFDTALAEAVVGDGVRLRIAATHEEGRPTTDRETLHLDETEITFDRWDRATISQGRCAHSNLASTISDHSAMLRHNLASYLAYSAGDQPRPTTRLEDTEPFVALHTLAMASSETSTDIEDVPVFTEFLLYGHWPGSQPRTARGGELY